MSIVLRAVQFVLTWMLLSSVSFLPILWSKDVLADEFVQVSPGNFARLGTHEEITANRNRDTPASETRGIANSGFVVGDNSVAVIDPGSSAADARVLKAAISARTTLPVSHVILSHFHPDHVLAGQFFADVPNVVAHRRYVAAMVQRGDYYLDLFRPLVSATDDVTWLLPTLEVDDVVTIDLGGKSLLVRAHPTAHTDNDISVMDKDTATLWSGDLLFAQRVPALDGSLTGWLQVLELLRTDKPGYVIPGHGQPGSWQQVAAPQLRYLQELLDYTRQQIAAGLSLSDLIADASADNRQQWLLYELYHARNLTKAYTELEWE